MLDLEFVCVEDKVSETSCNLTPSSPVASSVRRTKKEDRLSGQVYLASLGKGLRSIGFEQHLACLV